MIEKTTKRKLEETLARITTINSSNEDNDLVRLSKAGNQVELARAYDLYRGLSEKEYQELMEHEKRRADAAKSLSWAGYLALAKTQSEIRKAWSSWDHGSGYDKVGVAFLEQESIGQDLSNNGEKYLKKEDKFGNHSPLLTYPLYPHSQIQIDGLSFDTKSGRAIFTPNDPLMRMRLTALSLLECNAFLIADYVGKNGVEEDFVLGLLRNLSNEVYGSNDLFIKFRPGDDERYYDTLFLYGEEPKSEDSLPIATVISPGYSQQEADVRRKYKIEPSGKINFEK